MQSVEDLLLISTSVLVCSSEFRTYLDEAANNIHVMQHYVEYMVELAASIDGEDHYITLLCGTRSLMAMESRAIAGGLSADHQLPGVPNAKEVLLNKLIHNHSIDPPEIVTQ
jgi:hypothetical protein